MAASNKRQRHFRLILVVIIPVVLFLFASLRVSIDPLVTSTTLSLQGLEFPTITSTDGALPRHNDPHANSRNDKPPKMSIFYNLFLNSSLQFSRVNKLVVDQLSYLDPSVHNPVYINTMKTTWDLQQLQETVMQKIIFKKNKTTDGYPSQHETLMPQLNLTLLQHFEKGDEGLTLHSLWSHCQHHPDDTVMYIHDKGSFHPRRTNDMLRHFLTVAATSEACYQSIATTSTNNGKHQSNATCNLCGYRFSPLPNPHFPGNMWTARCDYIQHLTDPLLFEAQMDQAVKPTRLRHSPLLRLTGLSSYVEQHKDQLEKLYWGRLESTLLLRNSTKWPGESSNCIGRQRYAMEHWVTSHPWAKPCDVEKNSRYKWAYQGLNRVKKREDYNSSDLREAPRFPIHKFFRGGCHLARGMVLKDRIDEYNALYPGVNVTNDWWGWKTPGFWDDFNYPEGNPWQWFLSQGGNKTLGNMAATS